MIRSVLTVFVKEVRENLRDRRTLFSAFLFVPLLGPILFAVMTAVMVDRVVGEADDPLRLAVIGAEHAPNLILFFEENGAEIVNLPDDTDAARNAVSAGTERCVLVIRSGI